MPLGPGGNEASTPVLPAGPWGARGWLTSVLLLLLAVAVTVGHTWPLASDPAHLLPDNADAELNAWIVSWVAHQLPRDPAHLFDANIFYPERRALAFSEPLLPPGIAAVPLRGLGASAVLTHNLLLMAGIGLTAAAGFVAGTRLSGSHLGGLLAATVAAFGPHALAQLSHLQAQWLVTLPLCLLALDAALRTRTWRAAASIGLCIALLAVTSGYGLVLGVVAVGTGLLARLGEVIEHWRRVIPRLAAGAVLSVALAAPVLVPYWLVSRGGGLQRSGPDVAALAAVPASFLSTPASLHYALWSHRFTRPEGGSYFPGAAALVFAALALALDSGWKRERVRMLLAVAVAGGLLALGPATPLYGALRSVLPPMKALRDPSRFGALVVLSVALLAAMGLAAVLRRTPGRWRPWLALAVVGAAHAEVLCAPFDYARHDDASPVYARLASEARPVAVAEFPFYAGEADYLNAAYVLSSTAHWVPLVNGYSGAAPRAYEERARVLHHFPSGPAFDELHRLGVSHLVVHFDRYGPRRQQLLATFMDGREDVAWIATGPAGERLYRLRAASPPAP